MKVTVLLLSNRHGMDIHVYEDSGMAYRRLEQYVDERWDENMTAWSQGGGTPKPGDADEKIQDYFDAACTRESYEFFDAEVICAEPEGR